MDNDATDVRELNLGEAAHIVAASRLGPRGSGSISIDKRNDLENLVLLCPTDHQLIDNAIHKGVFEVEELRKKKQSHEELVKQMTAVNLGRKTRVLRMLGKIRGQQTEATAAELRMAVVNSSLRYPDYSTNRHDIDVDLRHLDETSPNYWNEAVRCIDTRLNHAFDMRLDEEAISHISVFALARIPLLVHLGTRLSDKVHTDLYQRHRTPTEGWMWPGGNTVQFEVVERERLAGPSVTLAMSISGSVATDRLDPPLRSGGVLEIRPSSVEPNRDLLNSPETLQAVRGAIEKAIRRIESIVGRSGGIRLLGAIPAPVAVAFGRELLHGVSPRVHVYDFTDNAYHQMMEILV